MLLLYHLSGLHTAAYKTQEDIFVRSMVFEGTSRSFKCYKSRKIGSEGLREFGGDSLLFFQSA